MRTPQTRLKPACDGVLDRPILDQPIPDQDTFLRMLVLERKRTERSRRYFVLMLVESENHLRTVNQVSSSILQVLFSCTRETDIKGWYKEGSVIGVIFTEVGKAPRRAVVSALLNKVTTALCGTLTTEQINDLNLSFHVYPEDCGDEDSPTGTDAKLYPDFHNGDNSVKAFQRVKRALDIAGSAAAILFFAPLFLLIAISIKSSSRGPVFFKQPRLGQYAREFTLFKFRSMRLHSDHTLHKEYVMRFIAAQVGNRKNGHDRTPTVYKLTGDPRVTRIGKILRRTSLDELPQFLNVLRGDMSLVGPRPPLLYEFGAYDIWHRNRVLAVKPGITGLWQIHGRSRVTFDDMVRLDLRYARARSLWLDIKILLQTPRAVLTGWGAY